MREGKVKVLFVCLGNICRSPLAEAIFNHKVKENKLDAFLEGDSCGTANYHVGDTPDPRTIRNAERQGVAIDHLGRQLHAQDLERFDYIFAMDESNYLNIMRLSTARANTSKISLMRSFDPNGEGEVPDPYHGQEQDFQLVFDILSRTMDNFIVHLRDEVLKV